MQARLYGVVAVGSGMHVGLALWKSLPAPVREGAHRTMQGFSKALIPLWARLARRPGRRLSPGAGAAVLGLFRSSIGLGQGARLFADGLDELGCDVERIDASDWINIEAELAPPVAPTPTTPPAGVVVSHLNPAELERAIELSRGAFLRRRRHIGYWVWELPKAPLAWGRAFDYVDEVWTPSRFSADALRGIAPADFPIHVVPHPMWAWARSAPDRAAFGLPYDRTLILVALDLKSTSARKNPEGAVDAYLLTAKRTRASAMLVCKVSGTAAAPEAYAALKARCAPHDDIVLIDQSLSSRDMGALVASADIVFSPHRAEGFGLLLAEGMRLGKAVVATRWSGNMDFMDDTCAKLIDYRLTPVIDPQGLYAGSVWAEPDLDQAAHLLETLAADFDARQALGERARARGGPVFDPDAWRALTAERLAA